jgi:predicted peroxiredoxin
MSAADKIKLDNIIGISDNAKFNFCTASEYAQMENRTAAIYFVLNGSTLLIKDANDNLLTLGNAGEVTSEPAPTS